MKGRGEFFEGYVLAKLEQLCESNELSDGDAALAEDARETMRRGITWRTRREAHNEQLSDVVFDFATQSLPLIERWIKGEVSAEQTAKGEGDGEN